MLTLRKHRYTDAHVQIWTRYACKVLYKLCGKLCIHLPMHRWRAHTHTHTHRHVSNRSRTHVQNIHGDTLGVLDGRNVPRRSEVLRKEFSFDLSVLFNPLKYASALHVGRAALKRNIRYPACIRQIHSCFFFLLFSFSSYKLRILKRVSYIYRVQVDGFFILNVYYSARIYAGK